MNKQSPHDRNEFWTKVVCSLSHEPPSRFYHDWLHGANPKMMEQRGIFIRDTPQKTAYCPRCHDASPVESHRDINGQVHYWRTCCFPVKRVNPKTFRVWLVNAHPLFAQFREQTGIKGSVVEVMPGLIWKWGRRGQQPFVYVRRVVEETLKSVAGVLKQFPESVIITPRAVYLETLGIVLSNRGIAWDEVTSLDDNNDMTLDMEKIGAELTPPERTRRSQAKSRLEKIDRLVAAMKDHYLLAKAHYRATGGAILRRPTQAELAERAGVNQNVVSRCLADNKGIVLRMLWENAENPQAVLKN